MKQPITPPEELKSGYFSNTGQVRMGAPSTVTKDEYLPYMPQGVYDTGDINLQRAQNQGMIEGTGKFLGNTLLNVGTGIVETAGYLGALATEWGDERDYSNPITELMQQWKNPFGEIFRENPEETFDLSDPAWWSNNASGLISSVAQFAVAGAGIGSVLGKGAAALAKTGAITARVAGLAAQTGTAAALAYTEGAMAATEVYKSTYATQLEQAIAEGMDPEEAKVQANQIASQSAATTAQINTAINTVLNFGAVSPLFHEMKATGEFFRRGAGARQGAEELADWSRRLATLDDKSKEVMALLGKKGVVHYGMEAGKEGVEEMVNQFAEVTGRELGEEGTTKGLFAQFAELDNFFDRTMNEEGALNFILGAVGGVGNTVALDFMPVHRDFVRKADGKLTEKLNEAGEVVKNSKGEVQYEKKFYTGRFLENNQRYARFDSAKDAVLNDIEHVSSLNLDLKKAIDSGDVLKVQQIRNKLLSTHHLNAITKGEGAQWKVEYEQYRDLDNTKDLGAEALQVAQEIQTQMDELVAQEGVEDASKLSAEAAEMYAGLQKQLDSKNLEAVGLEGKTEAMVKGFATSMKDNEYKKRASEAIADLGLFTEWFDELRSKFAKYQEEDQELNVTNAALIKKINNHYDSRALDNIEETINEIENAQTISNVTSNDVDSLLQQANNQYVYGHTMARGYTEDAENLRMGKNVDDLLSFYGIEYDEDSKEKAIQSLTSKLKDLARRRMEDVEDFHEYLKNSPEYARWASKGKNKTAGNEIQDFINWMHGEARDNETLVRAYRSRDTLETRVEIASEQIAEIEKSPRKYIKNLRKDLNKAKAEFEDRLRFVDGQVQDRINERLTALNFRIDRDTLIVKRIEKEIDALRPSLEAAKDALEAYQDKQKLNHFPGVLKRIRRLYNAFTKIEARILAKQAVIDKVNSEIGTNQKKAVEVKQDIKTPVEPIPAEKDLNARITEARMKFLSMISQVQSKIIKSTMAYGLDKFLDDTGIKRVDVSNEVYEQILTDAYDELASRVMSKTEKETLPVDTAIQKILLTLPETLREEVNDILSTRSRDMTEIEYSWNILDEYITGDYLTQSDATKLIALTEKVRSIRKKFRDLNEGFSGSEVKKEPIEVDLNAMSVSELGEYLFQLYPEEFKSLEAAQEGEDFATLLARKGTPDRALTNNEEIALRRALLPEEEMAEEFPAAEPEQIVEEVEGAKPEPEAELEDTSDLERGDQDTLDIMYATAKATTSVGVAALHLNYEAVDDGNGVVTNRNLGLNTSANLDPLLPGVLEEGSELMLRVLPGYTGKVYDHTTENRDAVDAKPTVMINGKIPEDSYDSIPIEIIDTKTGKRIGFVHTMDWVTERKGNYRNVAVSEDSDGEDNNLPSIEDLIQDLSALRTNVISQYQDGKSVKISVRSKGPGRLIRSEGFDSVAEMIPDESVEVTVDKQMLNGVPMTVSVINVPMADGSIVQSKVHTLGLQENDIDVIMESIKAYVTFWNPNASPEEKSEVTKKVAAIQKLTGFDITNSLSLKAFINRHYTNTSKFSEADLAIKENSGTRFLFDILPGHFMYQKETKSGNIKLGQAGRGDNAIYAITEDGALNPFFELEMRKGLATHKKMPVKTFIGGASLDPETEKAKKFAQHKGNLSDVHGIGSDQPLQEVAFDPVAGFVAKGKPHKNYNAYAKSFTATNIDGRNKVNGTYVYAVHPNIEMDLESMSAGNGQEISAVLPEEQDVANITLEEPSGIVSEVEEELDFDEANTDDTLFSRVIRKDSSEVLKAELTEMHRNAPFNNGKSVEEVMQELKDAGLEEIPEGFNPFRKC